MNTFWTNVLSQFETNPTDAPLPTDTWISPLADFSALEVAGPDAQKFLQGQLSCDVNAVNDNHASLGSHCNPQGRMVSNFRLYRPELDKFVLVMRNSLLEIAQKQLQKYIVFSKANVTNVSPFYALGLHGPAASQIIADLFEVCPREANGAVQNALGTAVQVDNAKQSYEIFLSPEHLAESLSIVLPQVRLCEPSEWEAVLIEQGILYLEGSQSGEHIPLVINWDALGGVSFKKGCYTGQEIVARLHYRGKAKRHLRHFSLPSDTSVDDQRQIIASDTGNAIGEIVRVAHTKNLTSLLSILNLSSNEALPTLHIDHSGPALTEG